MNIPDDLDKRVKKVLLKIGKANDDWHKERDVRDRAMAAYLGWYEKPTAKGIWYYIDDLDNQEELIHNEWETMTGLPFFYDHNYVHLVYDKLCRSIRRMDEVMKNRDVQLRQEGEYVTESWFISQKECVCVLSRWENGNWNDDIPEIIIEFGKGTYTDFGMALYFFASQIILTITNKLNELP